MLNSINNINNINTRQSILILEDDEDLSDGIRMSLESPEFCFTCCHTISEAKKALDFNKFDLLILDISLPDGSGLDFCKEIRKTSHVPVVLLTAKDMELDIVIGLECGADDYITKPFNVKILLKKIELILNRNNVKKDLFTIKDLSINFEDRTVKKSGEIIYLTPTEFDLLQVFVKNKSIVLTRQILLEKLWDSKENFVDEHTLTLNISRLRSKLDKENDKYIETIYGVGYKLAEE